MCVCVLFECVNVVYLCARVYVCTGVYRFVCVHVCLIVCYSDTDSFGEIGTHCEDSKLCSLWTRYIGDLKTDAWDDPEIRSDSYSEDQTAIRIQTVSFHVSVCSCVISLFTVVSRRLYVTRAFHVND